MYHIHHFWTLTENYSEFSPTNHLLEDVHRIASHPACLAMLLQFFTSLDFSDQQDLIYSPSLFKQAFRKKSTCHRLILLCDYLIYNFWTLTLYIFYYSTRITCCNAISWNTLGNDTATTYHSTRTNNYPFQNNTTSSNEYIIFNYDRGSSSS